jgi:hypothetical protein
MAAEVVTGASQFCFIPLDTHQSLCDRFPGLFGLACQPTTVGLPKVLYLNSNFGSFFGI